MSKDNNRINSDNERINLKLKMLIEDIDRAKTYDNRTLLLEIFRMAAAIKATVEEIEFKVHCMYNYK